MAAQTEIAWCDSTFNPWQGCTKVSPGCDNCYAEARQDKRLHAVRWGTGQPRKRTKTWGDPVKWNGATFVQCNACGWRGELAAAGNTGACPSCGAVDNYAETRRRVFCASLADVFDNEVPPEWRHDLFNLIEVTPNLDWLLLTKRPQNIVRMVQEAGCVAGNGTRYLPRHVWLGATAEDQKRANSNVIALLRAKETLGAHIAFLSIEPLLGPIRLWRLTALDFQEDAEGAEVYPLRGLYAVPDCDWPGPKLDWVIVGGENGPGARPMHPAWVRSLRDQCAAAGVPFLFKQWGAFVPRSSCYHTFADGASCADIDPSCKRWPFVIRLTEAGHDGSRLENVDGGNDCYMQKVGKEFAGRLLDGVEHNWFPEPAR